MTNAAEFILVSLASTTAIISPLVVAVVGMVVARKLEPIQTIEQRTAEIHSRIYALEEELKSLRPKT